LEDGGSPLWPTHIGEKKTIDKAYRQMKVTSNSILHKISLKLFFKMHSSHFLLLKCSHTSDFFGYIIGQELNVVILLSELSLSKGTMGILCHQEDIMAPKTTLTTFSMLKNPMQ
jgi:hypothetical protein